MMKATPSFRRPLDLRVNLTNAYVPLLLLLILCLLTFLLLPIGPDRNFSPSPLTPLPSEHSHKPYCDTSLSYVFLHLHKTGGNNLKHALVGWGRRNNIRTYETCRRAKRDSLLIEWLYWRRKDPSKDYDCNLNEFMALDGLTRSSYDFILGHMYFGLHLHLKSRQVRYFTMMRDPIARKISHFGHFVLRGGNATDSMNLLSEDEKVRLYRYLLSKNRNYMTKRVGIVAAGLPEVYTSIQSLRVDISRQLAEKTLVNAKQHLIGHFFFVGLHERYEESMCILQSILNSACYGGLTVNVRPLNATKLINTAARPASSTHFRETMLPPKVQDRVRRGERLDVELYEFARTLFEAKLELYPHCRLD